LAALLLASCDLPPPQVTRVVSPPSREALMAIPMAGTESGLFTRICRPLGSGPFRVVVINHGSPTIAEDPLSMKPRPCDSELSAWFLARGFMVVSPMRRGFGQSGGPIKESSGSCETPDYVGAGLEGAKDIATVVDYVTGLTDARPYGAVVVGLSTGGWAVVAYDSLPHPRANALISLAGGRGAWAGGQPGLNCRPDLLARAAAAFARQATTPMLWLYAEDDRWFPPAVAVLLAHSYQQGGGKLDFIQLPATGGDGHFVFDRPGSSQIWGSWLGSYINDRNSGS